MSEIIIYFFLFYIYILKNLIKIKNIFYLKKTFIFNYT